jgi:hypothetical protein
MVFGQGPRQLRLWVSAVCAIAVALVLNNCTTTRSPGPRQAAAPIRPPGPAQASPSHASSLSAKQILDQIGAKWKYPDPPVVVFHSPG